MDSHARSERVWRTRWRSTAGLLIALVVIAGCHMGELLSSPDAPGDDGTPQVPTPNGARTLATVAGNDQRDTVEATLTDPYAVRVSDEAGRPLAGVTVRWTVVEGEGSVDVDQSVSDASGIARASHTLGASLGTHAVTASVASATDSPRRFTATALPGAPNQFTYEVGPSNSVMGQPISPPIRVALRDRLGHVVDGTGWSASIELVSGSGTPLAALDGTLAAPISDGQATFDDVRVTLVGLGYRVRVTFAAVDAASAPFDVALVGLP